MPIELTWNEVEFRNHQRRLREADQEANRYSTVTKEQYDQLQRDKRNAKLKKTGKA